MIDETEFRTQFRQILPVEVQYKSFTNFMKAGDKELFGELKLIKQLFKITGNLQYKKEYKRLKMFISDL